MLFELNGFATILKITKANRLQIAFSHKTNKGSNDIRISGARLLKLNEVQVKKALALNEQNKLAGRAIEFSALSINEFDRTTHEVIDINYLLEDAIAENLDENKGVYLRGVGSILEVNPTDKTDEVIVTVEANEKQWKYNKVSREEIIFWGERGRQIISQKQELIGNKLAFLARARTTNTFDDSGQKQFSENYIGIDATVLWTKESELQP